MNLEIAKLIALSRPCLLAEECAHPNYGHRIALGTLVLTTNSGYE